MISNVTTQLYRCRLNAAPENTHMDKHDCAPIKLYLHKLAEGQMVLALLIPVKVY